MNITWRTTYGRAITPEEMSHQHLSNILWYFDIFWAKKKGKPHPSIQEEINKRFSGIRLPYQPIILIKDEIDALVSLGYTDGKIGSEIIFEGVPIGKVSDERTKVEVFIDVDGWKAISIKEDTYDNNGPFWIYNSAGENVAYLSREGKLEVKHASGIIKYLKPTGMTFNPRTDLKQAMRYAFVKMLEPAKTA